MSGWPKPDEEADFGAIAAAEDGVRTVTVEVVGYTAAFEAAVRRIVAMLERVIYPRPRSKAMRKADQRRARAVEQIEKEMRREAQRRGGGSWRA